MKAKLINEVLTFASDFMFIESIGSYVSNPTDKMLTDDGYIDVNPDEISETKISDPEIITPGTGTAVIEETPAPEPTKSFINKVFSIFKR